MLPNTLVSIYQQYKQDTDSVASWLASTAKACGYPSDLLGSAIAPEKSSKRLKGKARSDARKNNKNNNVGQAQSKVPKHAVAVKDFIPLAEFIAAFQKPTIAVPKSFSTTINRLIAVRADFAQQLGDHGALPDGQSDPNHSYFFWILEKVREVLKPRMATAPVPASSASSAVDLDLDELTNRFDALAVYEPSQESIDAPVLERPQMAGEEVIYEAESDKAFYDVLVAYIMMINDLNKIRLHVELVWTNYRDGVLDSATAAVTTNTAIDLARNLMEDIIPLFKDHGGTWGMAKRFYLLCCLRKGFTEEDLHLHDPGASLNVDTYDIANNVYFLAYRILVSFLDILSPRALPLIKEGFYGVYDPTRDRDILPGAEKMREDQILLNEYFTELVAMIRSVPNYPVEDEFLRGMKEMEQTREIPFYLVFAAQIYLDIHHILRDLAGSAFNCMVEQTTLMDKELKNHLEFHDKLKFEDWPASGDHMIRGVQKRIKWVADDPVFKVKVREYLKQGMLVPDSVQPHRLLQHSPVLSGLVLFHFRAQVHDIGIAVANASGSIAYSWHLYNALQSEKLLAGPWRDMDVVEALIGESNFCVGSRPRNPQEYFSRFCLQTGVSAAHFTGGGPSRRGVALGSRIGPRGIKQGVPVTRMFMDRYLHNTGQVDWKPEHVEAIIARSKSDMELSAGKRALMLDQSDDPERLTAKRRKKRASGALLSPEQLLQPLTLALQAEAMELAFPYLLMHLSSWRLLRAVKHSCDPLLRQLYTPAYIEKESRLPFMVGNIFCAASGAGGQGQDMRPLEMAAQAVGGFVKSGVGEFVTRMMKDVLHFNNIPFEVEGAEDDSE